VVARRGRRREDGREAVFIGFLRLDLNGGVIKGTEPARDW
jgi:hypothetical protein